jgi:hypothetical protein
VAKRTCKSYYEELLDMVDEYKAIHGDKTVDPKIVIKWAIATGRYNRPPQTMEQRGTADLRRALRHARHMDSQGRTVRTNHPAAYKIAGEQLTLWADIREAEPEHMRVAFQQRRLGILADVKRHKADVDSYNDNNRFGVTLPLYDYNFNVDLEEAELPTEYDEDSVEIDFDDEDDLGENEI